MLQKIIGVAPGSIAEELGIEPGDMLVAIDGQEIDDVLDYYFYTDSDQLELCIRGADGEEWLCDIEKEEKEDLGLIFEEQFMGKYRHCQNKCIFCFIDQLPKGMRDTLYFKDDDARLSFLNGNYITLTNMREADFQKVIRYHMSPINVSVHTPIRSCGFQCWEIPGPPLLWSL
ncbi:MAG: PDZ domain-containing protein [Bianqueaceae bacterium]